MLLLNNTSLGLMVIGVKIRIDKLDNLKGTSQKNSRLVLLNLMVEWILMLSLIWLVSIEEYFDWYEMIDSEQIRFAKMKLTNSAKMYSQNVLQDMICLSEPSFTQWVVMKEKLQEKYISPSYKSQLFSNMINLKQMTLTVAEYFAKFEEARLRCREFHVEGQFVVCTRFVNGLKFDIQRMVKLHAPHVTPPTPT